VPVDITYDNNEIKVNTHSTLDVKAFIGSASVNNEIATITELENNISLVIQKSREQSGQPLLVFINSETKEILNTYVEGDPAISF
jgi:hypothetical protein